MVPENLYRFIQDQPTVKPLENPGQENAEKDKCP